MSTCPRCGSQTDPQEVFCTNCGFDLRSQPAISGIPLEAKPIIDKVKKALEISPPTPSEAQPPRIPEEAGYCVNCGAQLDQSVAFCTWCGQAVGITQAQRTPTSIAPTYAVSNSLVTNVKLLYSLIRYKRGAIFGPSPEVYSRLSSASIARSKSYLNYALCAFVAGLVLIFAVAYQAYASAPHLAIVSLLLALIPAVGYGLFMYRSDRLEPEPVWMLTLAIGWGAASTIPSYIVNTFMFGPIFGSWMGYAAFSEEPFKILGIYLIAVSPWLRNEFNDHLDGLMYGSFAGMGFSLLENMLYITRMTAGGTAAPFAALLRGLTMPMHILCTGLVGYWMGYLKINGIRLSPMRILPGLFLAIIIHMIWNTLGMLGVLALILVFVLGPACIYFLNKLAKEALMDEFHWGFTKGYAPVEQKKTA